MLSHINNIHSRFLEPIPRLTDMADPDSIRFQALTQALPQELQDTILENLLNYQGGDVTIDRTYKFPVQLQLNLSIRDAFAARYYSTTSFTMDPRLQQRWALAGTRAHFDHIRRIRYPASNDTQRQLARNLRFPNLVQAFGYTEIPLAVVEAATVVFRRQPTPNVRWSVEQLTAETLFEKQ